MPSEEAATEVVRVTQEVHDKIKRLRFRLEAETYGDAIAKLLHIYESLSDEEKERFKKEMSGQINE